MSNAIQESNHLPTKESDDEEDSTTTKRPPEVMKGSIVTRTAQAIVEWLVLSSGVTGGIAVGSRGRTR